MSPNTPQIFHVTDPETLVGTLKFWFKERSWSQVRKLITGRYIQVNGNLCLDEGRKLKPGDVVRLMPEPQRKPPKSEDLKILYLDQHVVVVEKPIGVTTLRHAEERTWPRRRKQLQPTLDELLAAAITKESKATRSQAKGRKPPARIRPVHRLDRDTSGVMVFARTPIAEQGLVQQFRKHSIHRRYLALCAGKVSGGTITSNLVEDRGDGKRGSTTLPDVGQRAVTHVEIVERLGEFTFIGCRLETGRTHQIRIHLSEAGHPLCGEKIYRGGMAEKPIPDQSGAPRIMLHAAELDFIHPVTKEKMEFRSPMPVEMKKVLDRLRKGSGPESTRGEQ